MADPWQPEPGPAQFARLKPEQQDAILGRGAGAAYRAGAFELPDVVKQTFDPAWGSMRRVKSLREILGKDKAGWWAQTSRMNLRGASDLLPIEIERIAAEHKVLVMHGDAADVAEILGQALQNFEHDEWLPREIRVTTAPFTAIERITVVGRYFRKGRVLVLNPDHGYWRSGLSGIGQYIADLPSGYLSTSDALHPLWHELGHAAHHRILRKRYEQWPHLPWTAGERQVALLVSQRAAVSLSEFMAEVFALLKTGGDLEPSVELMYTRLGGLKP